MFRPRLAALGALIVGSVVLTACDKDIILPGVRFPVRAPLEESVPVNGQQPVAQPDEPINQSRPIALPGMVANADWTQSGGNVLHDSPHGRLSAAPQLVWATQIGAGNSRRNRITASPVVAGGVVFAMDAVAHVTAVSLSGAAIWQSDLTAPFDRGGEQSGGGLAAAGGLVFATTGYGEVVGLNASNGAVVWRQRLGSPAAGAPAVAGDRVFVMSADGTGWAIAATSGKILWTLPAATNVLVAQSGASPAVDGTNVIFPFSAGVMLTASADTGLPLWTAAITGNRLGRAYANSGDITGDPVVTGGTVYVGTQAGRTGAFKAETGEKLWTAEDGALNPPLVVDGSVFVVNDQSQLVRLDAGSGERIWAVAMPYYTQRNPKKFLETYVHFGPVLAGGRLVTVSSDGLLRQFDPASGATVGSVALPGGAASDPALAQGMLFVVTTQGQLLAFR
ncbi:MAG: PQQ-binding-like beta-propeller repeat protein [bacterium]